VADRGEFPLVSIGHCLLSLELVKGDLDYSIQFDPRMDYEGNEEATSGFKPKIEAIRRIRATPGGF
jgi:hypothetical protein